LDDLESHWQTVLSAILVTAGLLVFLSCQTACFAECWSEADVRAERMVQPNQSTHIFCFVSFYIFYIVIPA